MKARFIKPALFVLLGIFLGMYFLRCGNDAGIGSDFDATKYYTKEEVDTMLTNYYTQSEIDTMISEDNSTILGGFLPNPGSGGAADFRFNQSTWNSVDTAFIVPVDGTISNLSVQAIDGIKLIAMCNFNVWVNSQNGLSLVYMSTDGTTQKVDSDIVSVSQGDILSLDVVETNSSDPQTDFIATFMYTASE